MNSCMWGAVHLHHVQDQMRRALRITDVEQIQQIFTTMENQIVDLQFKELAGPYGQLSWERSPCRSCTLFHNGIYEQFTAKVCVFSDSVLCLGGKCPQYPESTRVREQDRISNFGSTPEYQELDNLYGEPYVFEWKICPRNTTAQLLQDPKVDGERG